ncbi:hypothetical protein LIMNO130_30740 [Limnobacter sp. 130]|nr:hypothetical protein LIMNO130_30740 [Limnobacter sp. 130]
MGQIQSFFTKLVKSALAETPPLTYLGIANNPEAGDLTRKAVAVAKFDNLPTTFLAELKKGVKDGL